MKIRYKQRGEYTQVCCTEPGDCFFDIDHVEYEYNHYLVGGNPVYTPYIRTARKDAIEGVCLMDGTKKVFEHFTTVVKLSANVTEVQGMKIKDTRKNATMEYKDLKPGDVFTVGTALFMLTDTQCDDSAYSPRPSFCISLYSGSLRYFGIDVPVTLIKNCEVVIGD